MAKFYGTLQGNRSAATRCGTSDIKVSAQSYDGSLITLLRYNSNNELEVRLSVSDDSTSGWSADEIFRGSLTELTKVLNSYNKRKEKARLKKLQVSQNI